MSCATLTETAPALARSSAKPGKISSSARRPPARSAWGCRSCGVPDRERTIAVRRSRSKISIRSKLSAKAPATDSPPSPAPTTTARRPNKALILLYSPEFKNLGVWSIEAVRDRREPADIADHHRQEVEDFDKPLAIVTRAHNETVRLKGTTTQRRRQAFNHVQSVSAGAGTKLAR